MSLSVRVSLVAAIVALALPAFEVSAPAAGLQVKCHRALSCAAVVTILRVDLASTQPATPWVDAAGRPTSNATLALSLIERAADDGLQPDDYQYDELALLARQLAVTPSRIEDRSRFEAVLSAAMIRFFHDLHEGRADPRAIGFRLNAPRDRHDFAAELREASVDRRLREKVNELRPSLAQYRLLQGALARYRLLAVDDDDRVVPASVVSVVRPGDRCEWAARLGRRLVKFGDLSASEQALPDPVGRYEGAVVEGVKRFQTRHGLEPDGVLGKATLEALRVPLRWRVRQIELALERLRWLPHLGDQRLLVVNIPMFQLWAWDQIPPTGKPVFGMDVIVGRALGTQTPVFVATLREVVVRPYWNVPRSILQHEIFPALARDPGYLERYGMEIVRGDGDSAPVVEPTPDAMNRLRRGELRLRQRPGPQNSLGLIKFEFPNEQSIYMHGTPAQALFARSRRDFSHGCVRVEDPVGLAQWVLNDDERWNRERIVAATMGSSSIRVDVPPIQVILFYTTAAVTPDDGSVRFAADIYGHDARLVWALARRVVSE